jgi:molybdopterin converting factor small subunit
VPEPADVEVHLFAAARAAAGTGLLRVPSGSLGEVLDAAVGAAPGLAAVLPRCSYLLDETAVRRVDRDAVVPPGSRLDVLPPFAGG